jgi:hypothetical protein
MCTVAIDPNSLPRDAETLRKIVVDLAEQLDRSLAEQNKYQGLLRELLEAQSNWRCSRRPGRHGVRNTTPLARTTMTWMALRERGRHRRKRQARNGAGANLWHGI